MVTKCLSRFPFLGSEMLAQQMRHTHLELNMTKNNLLLIPCESDRLSVASDMF